MIYYYKNYRTKIQIEKKQFIDLLDLNRKKRSEFYYKFLIEDIGPENYALSIITNSHIESVILGTIEVSLLKNGTFFMEDNDANDSIIHYMEFNTIDKIKRDVDDFTEKIKSGAFFNGSIIHYMEFDDFKNMIDKIERNVEKIEDIFLKYKRKSDNSFFT
ncbi:MAG: hypothetical protein KH328_01470 [Staphylococcus sp.]|nr:hypothetical protein [Staphylococcus sp.]